MRSFIRRRSLLYLFLFKDTKTPTLAFLGTHPTSDVQTSGFLSYSLVRSRTFSTSRHTMIRKLLLLSVGLAHRALAMTCDSHTGIVECEMSVDGDVQCVWDSKTSSCANGEDRIGPGMVGTTSIESGAPGPLGQQPVLTPEGVQAALDALSLNSTFCDLPPDESRAVGISCSAYMPMWTYNATSGVCEEYIYGGCSGTDNLFEFEAVCAAAALKFCEPVAGPAAAQAVGPAADVAFNETVAVPLADAPQAGAMGLGSFAVAVYFVVALMLS